MGQRVSVVLADGQDLFVEGLGMILSAEGLDVVALAGDGRSTLEAVLGHEPDVLVVDPDLPGADLPELLGLLERAGRHTRVLLLGAGWDAPGLGAARLSRATSGRELAGAIRALAEGRAAPSTHGGIVASPAADEHLELLLRSLSTRERQVLALLARGWSNRRIAEECLLSLNTIRTHVQNVLVKLGVHSKLEAAALAVHHGLVPTGGGGAAQRTNR
jgi:two-component system nitrate/nitrite response regulator NarL